MGPSELQLCKPQDMSAKILCGAVVVVIFAVFLPSFCYFLSHHLDSDFTLHVYENILGKNVVKTLYGKVVWITGASSGIGEYLAYELAGSGCKLVLSARRQDELERVRDKCADIAKKANPSFNKDHDLLVLPVDLMSFSSHRELTSNVIDHFGQIDILVNNAGRSQRGFVENMPLEVEKSLLDLNVVGTISLTKAVLPHMLARKQGQIVVVSSVLGKWGFPYEAAYCASKFALHGYFDSLRLEVQDRNVNVLIVCPGPVESDIAKNAVTEKVNVSFGETSMYHDSGRVRMPTERCAKLMVISMVNNLNEVWISIHPMLGFTYLSQYTPSVFHWFAKKHFLAAMKRLYVTNVDKKTV